MKAHLYFLFIFAARKKCLMRKHWIDNLRWVTVLLVLLYHVIYFYNNKGVFGGVGGFGDGPQYQDVLMYILYPWFMPLLFILAGISAKYALDRHSGKEWFKSRTLKLLVPSTIGLFVFQWMTGYFNTLVARQDVLASLKQPVLYFLWVISGTGPLWFIQDLWLFSLILLLIRRITRNWHFRIKNEKVKKYLHDNEPYLLNILTLIICVLYWLGGQTLIFNPRPETADGLYNLYKPLFYLIFFLLGYYCFSSKKIQKYLSDAWWIDMVLAIAACGYLLFDTYGENNTTPQYLADPFNCIYGGLMCLAMMGWFIAKFDKTNAFAGYMTRSSFGIYIVHYLIIASIGSMMFYYTQLPPMAMYLILTVAVFTLSPLIYETIRRIPFVRWCVLGESKKKNLR